MCQTTFHYDATHFLPTRLPEDPEYIDRVVAISNDQGGSAGQGLPVPKGGFDIAALAAGGTLTAIDAVMSGTVTNAYALVRPPGHHAEKNQGMALCVFSNIAVAVAAAIKQYGLQKVAIVDWDAHHGNGTESIFYDSPNVLTLSIHQDQMVPGRGLASHRGEDRGYGYNINIPLPPGSGSGAYLAAFERVIIPSLYSYGPELIVVATGLDAAINDPTAWMLLLPESFRRMTRMLLEAASDLCGGRLVMSHEGGSDATMGPLCGHAIVEEIAGMSYRFLPETNSLEMQWKHLSGDHQKLQPHQDVWIRNAESAVFKHQ